ncbi:GlcG/HbpS family heme-binding protein [Arenibaculum pallidiluteum]|uniref:GlcG/HbpS family heme-binding protein n=1 Tax=Arenibaculum pallidiluteum TaxID=2812559 RepID=UPI001A956B0B|nr:heme-binding protein [Arenibaculum pallidiluteum]
MANAGLPQGILEYGPPITHAEAGRVTAAAEAKARAEGWPVVIAIVDGGGHLVMLHRLDHAQLGSIEVARRKAETSVNFKRPTKVLDDLLQGGGPGLRMLALGDACPIEGGVPLLRDGRLAGAIGVSGMQSAQDAQVAEAGAAALAEPEPEPGRTARAPAGQATLACLKDA